MQPRYKMPYYSAIKERYRLLKVDYQVCTEWETFDGFFKSTYDSYIKIRETFKKVTVVIDGSVASPTTLKFIGREPDSRLTTNIVGADYTKKVPKDIFHTRMLSDSYTKDHTAIRRRVKSLQESGMIGVTTEATIITGTKRKTKTVVKVLSPEDYLILETSYKLTAIKNKANTVYLISGGGLVKIGISSNPLNRFSKLVNSSPVPLHLDYTKEVPDTFKVEQGLHKRYAEYNSHGEWFKLSKDQVKEIIDYLDNL